MLRRRLAGLVRRCLRQPAVRGLARRVAARFPALAQRLRTRFRPAAPLAPATTVPPPCNPDSVLGPRFQTLMQDDLAQLAGAPVRRDRS